MTTETLKPCPFCGSNDRLRLYEPFEPSDELVVVTCDQCNANGPYYGENDSQSEAEAVALWNRREKQP
jgi:Lar family restriction alleviation protein